MPLPKISEDINFEELAVMPLNPGSYKNI